MSQPHKGHSNAYTMVFMVVLCLGCALVLSLLASGLKAPQEQAMAVDRAKQMLRAARIVDYEGHFQIRDGVHGMVSAKFSGGGKLEASTEKQTASAEEILEILNARIQSWLVDSNGDLISFKDAGIDETDYVEGNRMTGFAKLDKKLVYKILPNPGSEDPDKAEGWIVPVAGMGLWNKVVGYLALEPDGITVHGISWYWHAETPGLGGEISEAWWQSQFPGKKVFLFSSDAVPNLEKAPVGITVVRGTVADVYGNTPRALSAVDGMSGATLTGVGVTKAYKDTLEAYRPFLIKVNKQSATAQSTTTQGAKHG